MSGLTFHMASRLKSWGLGGAWTGAALLALAGFGPCQVGHDHSQHTPSTTVPKAPPPPASAAPKSAAAPPRPRAAPSPHAGHSPAATDPANGTEPLAGYAHVPLESIAFPQLGFTTQKLERRALVRKLRTTGWVTVDETRTSHVHAKVNGYVISSHGSFIGAPVKRGEPLVSLYSQGVLSAELELLSLVEQQLKIRAAAPDSSVGDSLDPVIAAARKRLTLWDIPAGQVANVERRGRPTKGVTLSAPRDGVVLARDAIDGMYVQPSTELFVISDLTKLWIVFDVFEGDMPHVKVGQSARFHCEGLPHAHDAIVSFIAPAIDPSTRSLRARVEVDNQDGFLRPGAFSTVELAIDLGVSLAVPEEAVLRTGVRDLVFVVKDAMAVPTEVELEPRAGGLYPVRSGLADGDEVVVGAQFLIDSESRLRGSSSAGAAHVH